MPEYAAMNPKAMRKAVPGHLVQSGSSRHVGVTAETRCVRAPRRGIRGLGKGANRSTLYGRPNSTETVPARSV